jgi:hypothetical protein
MRSIGVADAARSILFYRDVMDRGNITLVLIARTERHT